MMPGGRPTDYSAEIADKICERLLDGESLRAICADDGFPHRSTVMRWLGLHQEFRDQYARTKEEQAEALADEIVSISDEEQVTLKMGDKDGAAIYVFDSTAVARNRLRVDARKWVAAKLLPKKYGDKVQTELSGPSGGPVETVTRIVLEAG